MLHGGMGWKKRSAISEAVSYTHLDVYKRQPLNKVVAPVHLEHGDNAFLSVKRLNGLCVFLNGLQGRVPGFRCV